MYEKSVMQVKERKVLPHPAGKGPEPAVVMLFWDDTMFDGFGVLAGA
jgi:hypothetical protein